MIIGIPKEIKIEEHRVGVTPMGVATLTQAGHKILVQATAGEDSGFADDEYAKAGATVVSSAKEVFDQANVICKVKEPLPVECDMFHRDQLIFTYFHLANEEKLTHLLMDAKATAIAYETVTLPDGSLPLLIPMSWVAGRLAPQIAAHYLEKTNKGSGKLLSGVPGVPPCIVVVLGAGGTVGSNAAEIALGMGARVIAIDFPTPLARLSGMLRGRLETVASNPSNIASAVKEADVVIGAVLIAGARSPVVATKEMVKTMKPGSVIVDVAVDQGGCIETTRATSHSDPIYIVDGVIHYCVTNIPGIVPRTSTMALTNATLPYALKLANKGFVNAVKEDGALAKGVNVYKGYVTNAPVATSLGIPYTPLAELI